MKMNDFLALLIGFSLSFPVAAQHQIQKLRVTVADENGVPVSAAQVVLVQIETQNTFRGETDYAGRREFTGLHPGLYRLRVAKEGFYSARLDDLRAGETESIEITLNHEQELRESVNVTSSPPAIDPAKTVASENLNSREIVNIPYSTTRDFRNLLPFIPGVVQDATGQVHINGSATHQILDQLDGFNITHPASGRLELRASPDALRSIDVQGSRYSAEYGKASGGVLSLATGMGDDRLRFSATDFLPSLQIRKGVNLNGWTPRVTLSGPLRKKRAWFFNAADGDFNLDIINELSAGADQNRIWRLNNLAKGQVNLTQTNILITSFLINYFHADRAGLSPLNPLETTREQKQTAWLFTLKDLHYFANGLVLETGLAANQYRTDELPQGRSPYLIHTDGTNGNYFKSTQSVARRLQWIGNLTLPTAGWHGRHEFKVGADANHIAYREFSERQPIFIRRADRTLAREVHFSASPRLSRNNFELSGFAQDRWSVSDRWLVELGLRLDRDQIIRQLLVSPRFASSFLLTPNGETKITAGLGLFYDATSLDFITRPLAGQRLDIFYARDGSAMVREPVETSFRIDERGLKAPRTFHASLGLEHKLPAAVYLRVELLAKRGRDGFAFVNSSGTAAGSFELRNQRRDRYAAAQITLRRAFKDNYSVFASYTRSSARSSAVFDFGIDNPIFSLLTDGPLPWDTPNRLISWGWLPLLKGFDLAYALDWRDGYPYSLVNEEQHLVGAPNSRRFPAYFSLNLHAERRLRFLGFQWALRAGFNNVTNRPNATSVNNNIDSPHFLTFGGVQDRAFLGRIRFLGRK
jgi:hypothetical protein